MWGEGPWQDEPDQKNFIYKNYDCIILRNVMGVFCGYVRIPKNSKFLSEDMYMGLNVHGGITFAGENTDGDFFIGFDCGHYNDLCPVNVAMKSLYSDELNAKLEKLKLSVGDPLRFKPVYRDLQFVENEIMNMVDQMSKVRKITRRMEIEPTK